MYIVVYTLMLLITLCVGFRIYKVAFNPITVWASLWCLIGMLSNIAFYDYYPPSNFVNNFIIVGIIIYTIYCAFYGLHNLRICRSSFYSEDICDNLKQNVFWTVNIVAILFEIPYLLRAIRTLMNHGFQLVYLRGVLTDSTEGIVSGGLASIIRDSGVKNVFTLTALYAAVLIFTEKNTKQKRNIIILAIAETVEYCVANAARAYLVNFIFYVIFALLFLKRKSIISMIKSNKKVILLFSVLLVVGLIIQNSRASDMSILKTIYMYYCSGPSYLTKLLGDSSTAIRVGRDYYYGTVTLGFIANLYYYLKIGLVGINNSTVKLIASVITIKQYFVGSHTLLNAMCTCFYAFLVDWGIWGAAIGPLIAGILSCRYYKLMKKRRSVGSIAICIYVFYLMFRTVFKWDLLYIDFSVVLLLNYFICPIPGQKIVWGKVKQEAFYEAK